MSRYLETLALETLGAVVIFAMCALFIGWCVIGLFGWALTWRRTTPHDKP